MGTKEFTLKYAVAQPSKHVYRRASQVTLAHFRDDVAEVSFQYWRLMGSMFCSCALSNFVSRVCTKLLGLSPSVAHTSSIHPLCASLNYLFLSTLVRSHCKQMQSDFFVTKSHSMQNAFVICNIRCDQDVCRALTSVISILDLFPYIQESVT